MWRMMRRSVRALSSFQRLKIRFLPKNGRCRQNKVPKTALFYFLCQTPYDSEWVATFAVADESPLFAVTLETSLCAFI